MPHLPRSLTDLEQTAIRLLITDAAVLAAWNKTGWLRPSIVVYLEQQRDLIQSQATQYATLAATLRGGVSHGLG